MFLALLSLGSQEKIFKGKDWENARYLFVKDLTIFFLVFISLLAIVLKSTVTI